MTVLNWDGLRDSLCYKLRCGVYLLTAKWQWMVEHRAVCQKCLYIQSSYVWLSWLTHAKVMSLLFKKHAWKWCWKSDPLQMAYGFSTKSKKGNNFFSPKFSVFLMVLFEMNLRFLQKTEANWLPWLELTARTWQSRVPLWGLTSHRPGPWCGYAMSSTVGHYTVALGQDQKISGICYNFNK